jgi:CRP-like cAMP-binding protein
MSSLENNAHPSSEFQENLTLLREIYFFSGLPLETLKVFAYLCTREKYKPAEYIFQQGVDDGRAYYILEGEAQIERVADGQTTILRSCRNGEFLGGLTLLGDKRRLFSLKTVTEASCLVLSREKFNKTMEQFPNLMVKICRVLADRIDSWEQRFLAERADQCGGCMHMLGVTLI